MLRESRTWWIGAVAATTMLALACVINVPPHGWRSARGPVGPHDSFPASCSICHTSESWHQLRDDFSFDHLQETGTPLLGAHASAECLRCHNDRGLVESFAIRGCQGCHPDPHQGRLGVHCDGCHNENNWYPHAQIERGTSCSSIRSLL